MIIIFTYSSNEAGIHGQGAAAYAMHHHGAVYGYGKGRKGNSYGIPTKDSKFRTLPLKTIKASVYQFLTYAQKRTDNYLFMITAIGCGLANITPEEIAPMFASASENCWFDTRWMPVLGDSKKYWGTFENDRYQYTPEFLEATKQPELIDGEL